jgi:hypothetical protein
VEKEDLIVQQVNTLDSRCDDLDKRMRSFEAWARALARLALILGLGLGYAGYVLKGAESELRGVQATLKEAEAAVANFSQVKSDVDRLQKEVAPVGKTVDNRAAEQSLLGRIQRFVSVPPSGPYRVNGYFSDIRGLRDFGGEYVTLAGEDRRLTFPAYLKKVPERVRNAPRLRCSIEGTDAAQSTECQ